MLELFTLLSLESAFETYTASKLESHHKYEL